MGYININIITYLLTKAKQNYWYTAIVIGLIVVGIGLAVTYLIFAKPTVSCFVEKFENPAAPSTNKNELDNILTEATLLSKEIEIPINLSVPRIPVDYTPLPINPAEQDYYQTPNFDSETLPLSAFFKQNPVNININTNAEEKKGGEMGEMPEVPEWKRSILAGALTSDMTMHQPDYWNYRDDLVMNGGDFGGITPHEPGTGVFGAYPNARLNDNSSGYYPGVNPNTNSVGLPYIEHRKDDLRMGMGIPSRQAEMITLRK